MDGTLTAAEAAAELGYNSEYLRNLIRSGKIRGHKEKGRWMITKDAVEKFRGQGDHRRHGLEWLALVARDSEPRRVAALLTRDFGIMGRDLDVVMTRWVNG
jgi:excisionase family DNA binding protein